MKEISRFFTSSVTVTPVKTLESAVTTAWGVQWNEEQIARDILQNFFDANRDRLSDIQVALYGQDVVVSAPTAFNLERLFYIGSEKGGDDIGQYGEGFKAAAMCLLRDHGVTPLVLSGTQALHLKISPDEVTGTRLRPLIYEFSELSQECKGVKLILPRCSPMLTKAMSQGLTHFFYEGNALLEQKLWSSRCGSYAVYATSADTGYVFYRSLRRGEIPSIPIVLVIHKPSPQIERQIQRDRDRNAFGDKLMASFYKVFVKGGLNGGLNGPQSERILIEAARGTWARGHPLLSAIAGARSYMTWSREDAAAVFGDQHFALSHPRNAQDHAAQLEIDVIETQWKDGGRTALPSYFEKFGVVSARRQIEVARQKALEDERQKVRAPSRAERESLSVLGEVLRALSPEVMSLFDKYRAKYTVGQTEVVLGALKQGRAYRSVEVYLVESVFLADFPEAVSIYLHEHSHIFGWDGSRGFTDALTRLLETVIGCRKELDSYEHSWDQARAAVQRERADVVVSAQEPLHDALDAMGKEDLLRVLRQVPPVMLKKLL